jgi:hypothetical protein
MLQLTSSHCFDDSKAMHLGFVAFATVKMTAVVFWGVIP